MRAYLAMFCMNLDGFTNKVSVEPVMILTYECARNAA